MKNITDPIQPLMKYVNTSPLQKDFHNIIRYQIELAVNEFQDKTDQIGFRESDPEPYTFFSLEDSEAVIYEFP